MRELSTATTWILLALGAPFAAALLTRISTAYCIHRVRKSKHESWIELARQTYPLTIAIRFHLLVVPLMFGGLAFGIWEGRVTLVSVTAIGVVFLLSWAAIVGIRYRIVAEILPRFSDKRYWLKTYSLRFGMLLFFAVVFWLPTVLLWKVSANHWWQVFLLSSSFLGTVLFSSLGGSFLLLRLVGHLRPARAELLNAVAAAVQAGHFRAPRYVLEWQGPMMNAAAVPLTRGLLFSSELVDALGAEELRGVIVHELAHIHESPRDLAARYLPALIAGPVAAFVLVFQHELDFFECLIVLVLFVLTLRLQAGRNYRKLEEKADSRVAQGDSDAAAYVRALETMYRRNLVPAAMHRRDGTHPDLYERMLAVGIEPNYSRPLPPPLGRARVSMLITCVLLGAITVPVLLPIVRAWVYPYDEISPDEFVTDDYSDEENFDD